MSELALRINDAIYEYGPVPVDDEHIENYFHATRRAFEDAVVELLHRGPFYTLISNGIMYIAKYK